MIIVQQRRASVFGCVFAWGVFALFGQDILQDTHNWLTWCIFRWHVSFQDILKCKRGFATNVRRRVGEHQTTTIDGVEARDGLTNVEEYRKKCQTVAKERQIRSNTKSLWSGKFFHLKRRARKTTFWCRFSSSLHLRAKSQRAQHIICNIQTTFLNPAHRLVDATHARVGPKFKVQQPASIHWMQAGFFIWGCLASVQTWITFDL